MTQLSSLNSTPDNLKNLYNIPDRTKDSKGNYKPLKIGIYQYNNFATQKDILNYQENYVPELNNINFGLFLQERTTDSKGNTTGGITFVGSQKTTAQIRWNPHPNSNVPFPNRQATSDIEILVGICKLGLSPNDELYIYSGTFSEFVTYLDENKSLPSIPKIWSIYDADQSGAIWNPILDELSSTTYQIFTASGECGSSNYLGVLYGDIISLNISAYSHITNVGATNIYEN